MILIIKMLFGMLTTAGYILAVAGSLLVVMPQLEIASALFMVLGGIVLITATRWGNRKYANAPRKSAGKGQGCLVMAGLLCGSVFFSSLIFRLPRDEITGDVAASFDVIGRSAEGYRKVNFAQLPKDGPPPYTFFIESSEAKEVERQLSATVDEACRPGSLLLDIRSLEEQRQAIKLTVICDEMRHEYWYEATADTVKPLYRRGYGTLSTVLLTMVTFPIFLFFTAIARWSRSPRAKGRRSRQA